MEYIVYLNDKSDLTPRIFNKNGFQPMFGSQIQLDILDENGSEVGKIQGI